MKKITTTLLALGALLSVANPVLAQSSTSYWSQCSDNSTIVRCETYNCPKGDTNRDGVCDTKDEAAAITETRNDSFCANPPSGCGQVLYFATGQNASCAVRVKESGGNCDLYKAGDPNFAGSTPAPTATAAPRFNTSPLPSATATAAPVKTLPKTGPALWASIFVAGLGMYGLYLYEKPRKDED